MFCTKNKLAFSLVKGMSETVLFSGEYWILVFFGYQLLCKWDIIKSFLSIEEKWNRNKQSF